MDHALLEHTLRGLATATRRDGLDRALAIAARLLEDLFDDRVENFRDRSRRHATYQALLAHAETPIGRRDAWTSVRVYEQVSMLPSDLARGLSFTHHRLLLGVVDADEKRAIARDVLRTGMSKRDLEQRIAAHASEVPARRPGRPRAPEWVKGLRQVRDGVGVAADPAALRRAAASMDVEQLEAAAADLESHIAALAEIRSRLEAVLVRARDEAS